MVIHDDQRGQRRYRWQLEFIQSFNQIMSNQLFLFTFEQHWCLNVFKQKGRLPKHGNINVGGGLVICSTMLTTFSWQQCNDTSTIAPISASSTMGSQDHGMEHTKATVKASSGSGKPPETKGADARPSEVPTSPGDGRVLWQNHLKNEGFVSQDHIGGFSTKRECANTHK
jgi:hypothetical protein